MGGGDDRPVRPPSSLLLAPPPPHPPPKLPPPQIYLIFIHVCQFVPRDPPGGRRGRTGHLPARVRPPFPYLPHSFPASHSLLFKVFLRSSRIEQPFRVAESAPSRPLLRPRPRPVLFPLICSRLFQCRIDRIHAFLILPSFRERAGLRAREEEEGGTEQRERERRGRRGGRRGRRWRRWRRGRRGSKGSSGRKGEE